MQSIDFQQKCQKVIQWSRTEFQQTVLEKGFFKETLHAIQLSIYIVISNNYLFIQIDRQNIYINVNVKTIKTF